MFLLDENTQEGFARSDEETDDGGREEADDVETVATVPDSEEAEEATDAA